MNAIVSVARPAGGMQVRSPREFLDREREEAMYERTRFAPLVSEDPPRTTEAPKEGT